MCRMLRTTTDQDRPSCQMGNKGKNETQRSMAKNPRRVARNHHNVSKLLACAAALTTLTHTHTRSQPPTDTHAGLHTLIDNHRASCPGNIWQQTYYPLKYPYRDTRAVWSNIALRCGDGSNCGAQDAGVYKRPMLHHQLRGGGGRGRGGEIVPKGVECLFKNMCFTSC